MRSCWLCPAEKSRSWTEFCADTGIEVEWELEEAISKPAGTAFQSYALQQTAKGPRRILGDFVIGAHAFVKGYTPLALHRRIYKASFPMLTVVAL